MNTSGKNRELKRSWSLMEELEARNLRTMTLYADGTLELVGTTSNDYFAVQMISPLQMEVRTSATTAVLKGAKFPISKVKSVLVKLDALNDTLATLPGYAGAPAFSKPMTVYADTRASAMYGGWDTITTGAGNDTIYGFGGGDVIKSGEGNDLVFGYDEVYAPGSYQDADEIDGGAGEDVVHAGPDMDDVTGGDDSDDLFGDEAGDIISGGDGYDYIEGGDDADIIDGDDDTDEIRGGGGSDWIDGGDHGDFIYGDAGDDVIHGGTDSDEIWGGDNDDLIIADDSLAGDNGWDKAFGEDGNDTLRGGNMADELDGGEGDDWLYGEDDNDDLIGGAGNDNLYGGDGFDELFGQAGLDGLFGGRDDFEDYLEGGNDCDRFLNPYTGGSALFQNWEDDVADKKSEDARIGFKDDGNWTARSGGVAYTYGPGAFSDSEIEQIDAGLRVLHHATGNKQLLEQQYGNEIEFLRNGADSSGVEPAGAWNDGGQIHMLDITFTGTTALWVLETTLHEIGHYWDREYDKDGWWDLSGWKKTPSDTTGMTHVAGSDYWFETDELGNFVSKYAMTNPDDDFSESFANYFMNLAGLDFSGPDTADTQDISGIADKQEFFDNMLADLS